MSTKKHQAQAEGMLLEAVELLEEHSGDATAPTATAVNNLGLFFKLGGRVL
jgi:hypothetical protein